MISRIVLALMIAFAGVVYSVAQDAPAPAPAPKTVTIDFVKKDMRAVMQHLAEAAQVTVKFSDDLTEKELTLPLTVMFREVLPLEAAKSICKANGFKFTAGEKGWTISRGGAALNAEITPETVAGRFQVSVRDVGAVDAIVAAAAAVNIECHVPAVAADPKAVMPRISMTVRHASADHILRELGRLAGMTVEYQPAGSGRPERYVFRWAQ